MAPHRRIFVTGGALLSLVLMLACTPSGRPAELTPRATLSGQPAGTTLPSAALACPGESVRDIGDIDGDRVADPVVVTFGPTGGGPSYLDVHNSSAPGQVISGADVGMQGVSSLGSSTLVVDVNRDGCVDVVTRGNDGIFIIPGSVGGLVPSAARRLVDPDSDGYWGESIAVLKDLRLLVVGASAATKSPHRGGAVFLYPLSDDGTPGTPVVLHQDSPGVPGNSEAADGFGSQLAADGKLLAIGAPGETNNRKRGSGAVTILKFTGVGLKFNALRWTQDSKGFETRAETGDEFGSRLAVRGSYVAIGVPEEDIGRASETGIVHVVELAAGAKPKAKKVYNFHQNSPGIPDKNETNDRWGSAVALGRNVGCTATSVVIGAHGEKVGKTKSGAVILVGLGKRCANRWLPATSFGLPFVRYFGRQIVTLSAASVTGPDTVLVGDAFSRAAGDSVYETGYVTAISSAGPGRWKAQPVPPRDGYHAFSNYGQGLGLASHG